LRATNELLEKVFSNIHVMVAYMDTRFNFIRVNRAYAEADEHAPDFFIGRNHFDLYPDEENEAIFRKVLETGVPYFVYGKPFEYRHHPERGVLYWDWSLQPVREADTTISGLVLSLVNVTERHRAENALRESEEKFRKLSQEFNTLLDAIPDTIILLSPELRILWANRGAAGRSDACDSSPIGSYCYRFLQGKHAPCEGCPAVRSFSTAREEGAQLSSPGGKLMDLRAFPIRDEGGGVQSVIIISSDITEKMMLQAEVMRADHLASVGKLAAGVAHEINNPINGIINYAQILANKSERGTKENDIAARIIKEGDRIAGIVKSLLSFARDRKEEKKPVPVYEILSDSLALTGAQMQKDGITIKMETPAYLPEIIANPQQIQQVFLNVISNARYALNQKYRGKHKGKLFSITGEPVSIDNRPHVRITFHDRGTGMPPGVLDKIINPFFSTKSSGTGLGMSISHGIICDHGGKLLIESEEGEFTRVTVELPARERRFHER
ncbi:MAG: PAS domain-containing protein, partial [Nitrospirales bacterium]|nr:PAS domain-containing protein [Nitrospirales bacterium]